jgi:hypothetical protein
MCITLLWYSTCYVCIDYEQFHFHSNSVYIDLDNVIAGHKSGVTKDSTSEKKIALFRESITYYTSASFVYVMDNILRVHNIGLSMDYDWQCRRYLMDVLLMDAAAAKALQVRDNRNRVNMFFTRSTWIQ